MEREETVERWELRAERSGRSNAAATEEVWPIITFMRFGVVIAIMLALCTSASAVDLPTVSVDHLYYLRARGEHIRRLSPDDMIDYCIAQKIGGRAFEDLYAQLFVMRIDLAKLQRIEGLSDDDSRVKTLKKTYAAEFSLLSDE